MLVFNSIARASHWTLYKPTDASLINVITFMRIEQFCLHLLEGLFKVFQGFEPRGALSV